MANDQPTYNENVKFDLHFQYRMYLQRIGLKEEELSAVQSQEMKNCFFGACGQLLVLFHNDITKLPDADVPKAGQFLIDQVAEFFKAQQ